MLQKLKSNFGYAISAIIGLFSFIFMAMPYFTLSVYSLSESASGYAFLSVNSADGFIAFLILLTAILTLVMAVLLLAFGAIGLLSGLDLVDIPASVTKFTPAKLAKTFLKINMIISIIFFVWILLVVIGYADSYYTATPGIGVWLSLIFSIASVITNKILTKKFGAPKSAPTAPKAEETQPTGEASTEPVTKRTCPYCLAEISETDTECPLCGSVLEQK